MADELPLLRVIIAGEAGKLADLPDIMKERHGDQKVPLEVGIIPAEEVAQIGDAQRVLREAAHKAVVDALRGGRIPEGGDKFLVFFKESFQKFLQIFVPYAVNVFADGAHHVTNVLFRYGHVVGRVVLALAALARPLDIELKMSLKRHNVSGDVHIIELLKIADAHAVGLPDLGVDHAGLVLKGQALVVLAVLGDQRDPLLAQIDVLDAASLV